MSESCENCRFWRQLGVSGWCRRYPPFLRNPTPEFVEPEETDWFPYTESDDWCGEYVRKEERE